MFNASTLVTVVTLLGSVLGLTIQVLLAKRFGLSIEIDAYMLSLALPNFVASTFASIINYLAVPRLASSEVNKGQKQRYIISLLTLAIIVGIIIILIGIMIIKPFQISSLPDESAVKNHSILELLLSAGWILAGIQTVNSAAVSVLNACKYHVEASFSTLVPYIGPVIILSIYSNVTSSLTIVTTWIVATAVITLLLLIFIWNIILNKKNYKLNIKEITNLIFESPKAAIAMSCFASWATIDSFWAPHIGPGALTTLAFAQRLLIAAGNIAVIGPITTLTPDLAKLAGTGQIKSFINLYLKTQLYICITAIVVALLIYIFGRNIIELVFVRGAMTANDAHQIASTLNAMLPGMVAMLMSAFAFRVIFCFPHFYTFGAIIGAAWSIQYYILCKIYHIEGLHGIAISYDISWITSLLLINIQIFIFTRKFHIKKSEL